MSLIAELYEGEQLRLFPLDRIEHRFHTARWLPPKFEALEAQFPPDPLAMVSDEWEYKGRRETAPPWNPFGDHGNWVTEEWWIREFGIIPKDVDPHNHLVPVTWIKYVHT